MTISDIEHRIGEIEIELKSIKDDVSDAMAYAEGIDERRLRLESELEELKVELNKLKKDHT